MRVDLKARPHKVSIQCETDAFIGHLLMRAGRRGSLKSSVVFCLQLIQVRVCDVVKCEVRREVGCDWSVASGSPRTLPNSNYASLTTATLARRPAQRPAVVGLATARRRRHCSSYIGNPWLISRHRLCWFRRAVTIAPLSCRRIAVSE